MSRIAEEQFRDELKSDEIFAVLKYFNSTPLLLKYTLFDNIQFRLVSWPEFAA